MRTPRALASCCLLLSLLTAPTLAQPATDTVTLHAPAAGIEGAVALNGPWKFKTGDDPQWSSSSFDDSAWQDYTIDLSHPLITPSQAIQSDALPGWQSHGHPAYTGYAWYRIRLQLPSTSSPLSLLMPQHVDDIYAVYLNGQQIGSFGKLDDGPVAYNERSHSFPLPAQLLSRHQPAVLAIRFWNARSEAAASLQNLAGGLRGPPLLGPSSLIQTFAQYLQYLAIKVVWTQWLIGGLYITVGIVSLTLFVFSRTQREYLWAGISLIGIGITIATGSASSFADIPIAVTFPAQLSAEWIGFAALPLALMYLLSVPRRIWRRVNFVLMAAFLGGMLLNTLLNLALLPSTSSLVGTTRFLQIFLPCLLICLLTAIAIDGVRTIGRRAWLPLAPALFFICGVTVSLARGLHLISIKLDIPFLAGVPLAILAVFLQRFTRQERENVRLLDDLKQAQAVQQVLLPEAQVAIPGFTIESDYRPAREVGGDFFQIIPHPSDSSFLVVLGDVTGKGLQAGMLVALLVGAIRTEAAHTSNPAQILAALNLRLHARDHAHATCLALHIDATGAVTLANAGHLPPYMNGRELPMEGSLPLGTLLEADIPVMHFLLSPGQQLTVMSDGIAEAQNKAGQLFGFERIASLLRASASASDLATAAQNHGQEDDILVLQIERTNASAFVSPAPLRG